MSINVLYYLMRQWNIASFNLKVVFRSATCPFIRAHTSSIGLRVNDTEGVAELHDHYLWSPCRWQTVSGFFAAYLFSVKRVSMLSQEILPSFWLAKMLCLSFAWMTWISCPLQKLCCDSLHWPWQYKAGDPDQTVPCPPAISKKLRSSSMCDSFCCLLTSIQRQEKRLEQSRCLHFQHELWSVSSLCWKGWFFLWYRRLIAIHDF